MSITIKHSKDPKDQIIYGNELKVGEAVEGVVVANPDVSPGVYLRMFTGIVNLLDPQSTWTGNTVAKNMMMKGHKVDIEITTTRVHVVPKTHDRVVGHSPWLRLKQVDWCFCDDGFLCRDAVTKHTPATGRDDFDHRIRLVAYDGPSSGRVKVQPDHNHELAGNEGKYEMVVDGTGMDTFQAFDKWIESLDRDVVWLDLEVE